MGWVLDLDGVVWLGDEAIPGAADAIARIRATGDRVVFVTNNSFSPVAAIEAKLASMGIPAEGDVVNSALAGATQVRPGERVLVGFGLGVIFAVPLGLLMGLYPKPFIDVMAPAVQALSEVEGQLLGRLLERSGSIEELIDRTGHPAAAVASALALLEARGLVDPFGGATFHPTMAARRLAGPV